MCDVKQGGTAQSRTPAALETRTRQWVVIPPDKTSQMKHQVPLLNWVSRLFVH